MSFRQGILCQNKQCQIKVNKHDPGHLTLSKNYLHGAPQIKNLLKKQVLKHGIYEEAN